MKYTLTEIVKQLAQFSYYRCGIMYYEILMPDNTVYTFNIPISDTANGSFNVIEKGVTLMRWIRKCMENGELLEDGKIVK
jgi:hypothetical protein